MPMQKNRRNTFSCIKSIANSSSSAPNLFCKKADCTANGKFRVLEIFYCFCYRHYLQKTSHITKLNTKKIEYL